MGGREGFRDVVEGSPEDSEMRCLSCGNPVFRAIRDLDRCSCGLRFLKRRNGRVRYGFADGRRRVAKWEELPRGCLLVMAGTTEEEP